MFAKFNLSMSDQLFNVNDYVKEGKTQFAESKCAVQKALDQYLRNDGTLDAAAIEADWFPQVDTDIFISHSHKDEKLAISLAGYLAKNCHVSSFIDSTVWGYADELLKEINDKYSRLNQPGKNGYEYAKVNRSAQQVYLLLQGALAKMINRCECLIFLNTPAAMHVSDIKDENLTSSPWIYSELTMASTFPPRPYKDYRIIDSYIRAEMNYNVCLDSFVDLSFSDIEKARNETLIKGGPFFLDKLYENKGILKR